jgi:glycosyltransferase involved in cell wall biosynthesis
LHVVFAGPGSPSVEGAFARHTDPRIHRVGVVGDHAKSSLLRECLMMCMPSREESLGVTYLEAWMAAKPIIAVPVPPILELTSNGSCGGLVVEPTPAAIADAISTLADNPARAASLAQQGHALVLSRYAWPSIASRTAQVYTSLLHPS